MYGDVQGRSKAVDSCGHRHATPRTAPRGREGLNRPPLVTRGKPQRGILEDWNQTTLPRSSIMESASSSLMTRSSTFSR